MNTSFKTLAIAGLVSAFALPALAQTAGDVSTMTCGDFMSLDTDAQMQAMTTMSADGAADTTTSATGSGSTDAPAAGATSGTSTTGTASSDTMASGGTADIAPTGTGSADATASGSTMSTDSGSGNAAMASLMTACGTDPTMMVMDAMKSSM